jgi:hypothetical protein
MFEFTEGNECFWPVKLPRRTEAGEIELCEVLVRYRIFTRKELAAKRNDAAKRVSQQLADAIQAVDGQVARETALDELAQIDATTEAEVRERITGWKGITRNGEEMPFSADVLDLLLTDQARYEALRDGLYEASRGARAKN